MPLRDRTCVLVTRRTRLEELTARFNTRSQARFYVERAHENAAVAAGASLEGARTKAREAFADYEHEDLLYQIALGQIRTDLERLGRVQVLERSYLPNYVFGDDDLVVTVGPDGLVANTAKYALERPIVAVNPDPERFDGVLLPFSPRETAEAVRAAGTGAAPVQPVTLAEARLNDGQRLLAFNDLFIGSATHVSARYRLEVEGEAEDQISSGVLVSTGAGSTGWMSSVFQMARAVTGFSRLEQTSRDGRPAHTGVAPCLSREERRLIYVVREPFVSRTSGAALAAGLLEESRDLVIESRMPTSGVIFSDGVEADFLAFNSGAIARIGLAPERAHLVLR